MTDAIVVLSTFPDADQAAAAAKELVKERLAACVNIIPALRSIYLWDGKLNDESEVLCLIKTTRDRFDQLEVRLRKLHPYQVPEVIALPVVRGHDPYLLWLRKSTG